MRINEESYKRLLEAAKDLRYLLDRGYKKESAVNFVSNRYSFNKVFRSILYRAVISKSDAEEIRKRHASPHELLGSKVAVDGFNLINTLNAAVRGELLVLCDDGVIRDVSEVHGSFKFDEVTRGVIRLSIQLLKELGISEAVYYYESQISRSGEISAFTRNTMSEFGLVGYAVTTKSVDSAILREGCIAITSDSALILRVKKFFDLAGYAIARRDNVYIIKL